MFAERFLCCMPSTALSCQDQFEISIANNAICKQ